MYSLERSYTKKIIAQKILVLNQLPHHYHDCSVVCIEVKTYLFSLAHVLAFCIFHEMRLDALTIALNTDINKGRVRSCQSEHACCLSQSMQAKLLDLQV